MPRTARLDVPGLPRHLGVRAINGMACFTSDLDRNVFMKYLREALVGADCHLHAFVLMSNHVHVLATGHRKGAASELKHSVGMRYARYFNRYSDRTGPLFEGRYWSSIIESKRYLLEAMRYIELNPVRAGIVEGPGRYSWSSYAHNTARDRREELTFHAEYLGLGATPAERGRAWADLVAQGIGPDELERIRNRFIRNRPLGSGGFEKRFGDVSADTSPNSAIFSRSRPPSRP